MEESETALGLTITGLPPRLPLPAGTLAITFSPENCDALNDRLCDIALLFTLYESDNDDDDDDNLRTPIAAIDDAIVVD